VFLFKRNFVTNVAKLERKVSKPDNEKQQQQQQHE